MTCEHPRESAHTEPHAVTPNPGLWHAPDNDSTECEVTELVAALVRAIQPELVVETGTAYGFTSAAIGAALRMNGHGRCVSLEVDKDRINTARDRLYVAGVDDLVEVREQSSLDFDPAGPINFALFDSLYELRAAEFRRYHQLGHLQPGTIVAFHDWTSGIRGHYKDVRAEVENLRADGLLTPIYVPTPRGLVIAETR